MFGTKNIKGEVLVACIIIACVIVGAGTYWWTKTADTLPEQLAEGVLREQYGIDIDFSPEE